VESSKLFEALQISRDAFIELCVLLGNDFNERIHLVGPVKSLALLKKHLTLDNVLDFLDVEDEKQKRMRRTLEIFKCYCFET
jgi:flap endonuclease-1